ncbi:MAG: YbaB/EbfC family nucleoid-associated protein [Acidobacteria bacterium CG_4_9_14_3_um_filter_49_7]|nr:MAG: YbaB/EbfC family nucleoid-associated protein [Acidobacteria bacterium CG_4_9_14_3_um_filter_49_7]
MVDMNFLMKQAKKMQEKLQSQLEDMRMTATAGGGVVSVTVNGHKEVIKIKIADDTVMEDREMLEDLLMAAMGEAYRKVEEELKKNMQGIPGGMLPGLM